MLDTFAINTDPPTNFSVYPPPMPLIRQIGEHKWYAGVAYLSKHPQENEVVVAEHYTGWNYVLARSPNANVFIQKTYNGTKLIWSSNMSV